MSGGRIVYGTDAPARDRSEIGRWMGGGGHGEPAAPAATPAPGRSAPAAQGSPA
jgi:hypothetical protein